MANNNLNKRDSENLLEFLGHIINRLKKEQTEDIEKIIRSRIIEDDKVISEVPEYKFARGLVNTTLKEILEEIK